MADTNSRTRATLEEVIDRTSWQQNRVYDVRALIMAASEMIDGFEGAPEASAANSDLEDGIRRVLRCAERLASDVANELDSMVLTKKAEGQAQGA